MNRDPRPIPAFLLRTLATLALLSAAACRTPPQPLHASSMVPAGMGDVAATEGANGNTKLVVRVEHLAPPSRLYPEASVYVVWIQPMNGEMQNVGALTVDNDLKGRLETVTPHRLFKLLVTPEPSNSGAMPTHEAVFSADVQRRD